MFQSSFRAEGKLATHRRSQSEGAYSAVATSAVVAVAIAVAVVDTTEVITRAAIASTIYTGLVHGRELVREMPLA